MEHDYVEVPGANNATYGFVAATAGDSTPNIPALTEPYHRVILGYIRADAGATSISGLTYWPAESLSNFGDDKLGELLFGDGADVSGFLNKENEALANVGPVPSEGIIGNRNFATNYFVDDFESITEVISDLDNALESTYQLVINVGNRAIDSVNWGALQDGVTHNVSTAAHGLMPKLPDDAEQFLNGVGSWESIYNYADNYEFERVSPPTILNISGGSSTGGTVDISPTYVPVGTKAIIVKVYIAWDSGETGSLTFSMWDADYSASVGPGLDIGNLTHSLGIPMVNKAQWTVPINAAGEFIWSTTNNNFTTIDVRLMGYIL